MSKVAIKGNASGTGTFTIQSPATNTDRVLSLPDEAGTVLTSASSINGTITNVDFWALTTNTSVSSGIQVLTSNWARFTSSSDHPASVGSAMTESSGVFTFPSTGIWLVGFKVVHLLTGGTTGYVGNFIQVSENGGSSFSNASVGWGSAPSNAYSAHFNLYPIDVSNISNIKVRFATENAQSGSMQGAATEARTSAIFIRVGDT